MKSLAASGEGCPVNFPANWRAFFVVFDKVGGRRRGEENMCLYFSRQQSSAINSSWLCKNILGNWPIKIHRRPDF